MGPGPALLASFCIWWGPSVQLSLHTDLPEARPMPQGLRRGHPSAHEQQARQTQRAEYHTVGRGRSTPPRHNESH